MLYIQRTRRRYIPEDRTLLWILCSNKLLRKLFLIKLHEIWEHVARMGEKKMRTKF
jgi:hypothetical protein